MLKIPKTKEWEENAFKFTRNGEEITAMLQTKEDRHEIPFRINMPPRHLHPRDVRFVALQFLERTDMFFLSTKPELMPLARRIVYYPGMIAN